MKYLDAQDVKAGRIGHTLFGPFLKIVKWLIRFLFQKVIMWLKVFENELKIKLRPL